MKRSISTLITYSMIVVFLCQNIGWTFPERLTIPSDSLKNIYISESYGVIEKSNLTIKNTNPVRQVILIKDAHCNYEAQENIMKILETLIRDYKIDLVCVEGAEGQVNTSVFQSFPYKDVREKTADKYIKKGFLSAGEGLSIREAGKLPFSMWGIEDISLYVEDFKEFRNTMSSKAETDYFIQNFRNIVTQLKKRIYVPELLEFDNKLSKYNSNQLSLTDFVKYLRGEIRYKMSQGIRNFNMIVKSIKLEEQIDYKAVENERGTLIKELEKTLTKEDLKELIEKSLLFRLGKIASITYYTYLEKYLSLTDTVSIQNLKKYIRLVKLQSKIDSEAFFSELKFLIDAVASQHLNDEIAKQLYYLSNDIDILNKLFNLGMTREDMEYYKKNKDNFDTDKLLSFIKIQAPLYDISLPDEFNNAAFLKKIDDAIIPAEKFYQLALERDKVLVKNLLEKMEKENKETAIAVVGGFHSQGIEELLQTKGVGVVTISPKITKVQEDSPYLALMMDNNLDIDSLCVEKPSNIALPLVCGLQADHSDTLHVRKGQIARELVVILERNKHKTIAEARALVDKGLLADFDNLIALAGLPISEGEVVELLLEAIKPENIMKIIAMYTDNHIESQGGRTFAEREVMRLILALKNAGVDEFLAFLEYGYHTINSSIIKSVISEQINRLQSPQFIYMDIPDRYFTAITTLPASFVTIPWNFTTSVDKGSEDKIILVYENNGFLVVRKKLSFPKAEKVLERKGMFQVSDTMNEKYAVFLRVMLNPTEYLSARELSECCEDQYDYDFNNEPKLKEIIYKGKWYSLEEFKTDAQNLFAKMIEALSFVAYQGDYLYRAIDINEWNQIKREGIYIVRNETNFEAEVGPQVKHYAQQLQDGYAGVIIRIPVAGPYFRRAGMAVPRITSMLPHYVIPEVLKQNPDGTESWIPLDKYLEEAREKAAVTTEDVSGSNAKEKTRIDEEEGAGGGFIGKYELLSEPVFNEKKNTFTVRVKNIETGEEKEVELKAKSVSADIIKERLRQLFSTIDNPIVKRIIDWFLNSFQGEVFEIEENPYGIIGIGQKGLISITNALLSNPIALFHEIGEVAIDAGIITVNDILNSLSDQGWYHAHMAKDGRGNMQAHYALRALQREVFGMRDKELTNKIKIIMQKIHNEQKKLSLKQRLLGLFNPSSDPLDKQRDRAAVKLNGEEIKIFQNGSLTERFINFLERLRIKKTRVIEENEDGSIRIYLVEDREGNRYIAIERDGEIEKVFVKAYQGIFGGEYFVDLKGDRALALFKNGWGRFRGRKDLKFDEDRFLFTAAFSQKIRGELLDRVAENPILYHLFNKILKEFPELRLGGGFLLARANDAGGYYVPLLKLILWQVGYGAPNNGLIGHEATHHIFKEDKQLYNAVKDYIRINHPKLLQWLQVFPLYRHSPDSEVAINEALAFIVESIIEGSIKIRGFDKLRIGDIKLLKRLKLLPEEYFPEELLSLFSDEAEIQEGFFYIIEELHRLRFEHPDKTLSEIMIVLANDELLKDEPNYGSLLLITDFLKANGKLNETGDLYEKLLHTLDKTENNRGIKIVLMLKFVDLCRIQNNEEKLNRYSRQLTKSLNDPNILREFVNAILDINLDPDSLRDLLLAIVGEEYMQAVFIPLIAIIEREIKEKRQELKEFESWKKVRLGDIELDLPFFKTNNSKIRRIEVVLNLYNELYCIYRLLGDINNQEQVLREIDRLQQEILQIRSEDDIIDIVAEQQRRQELEKRQRINDVLDNAGDWSKDRFGQESIRPFTIPPLFNTGGIEGAYNDRINPRILDEMVRGICRNLRIEIPELPSIDEVLIGYRLESVILPASSSKSRLSAIWTILKLIYIILTAKDYSAKEKKSSILICLSILKAKLKKRPDKGRSAYFGEEGQENINPQVKKIMSDKSGRDFYCMYRASDEGVKGNLEVSERSLSRITGALGRLRSEHLALRGYDVVILSGVNFSGHYGRSRQRIYIPIEILEIAGQNPDIADVLIEDFIEHEYLESRGMSHDEVVERLTRKRGDINKRAQELYRKYIIAKLVPEIKELEPDRAFTDRLNDILEKVQRNEPVIIGDINLRDLLLSIEKADRSEITPKVVRIVNLVTDDSYKGNKGQVVLAIEKAIVDALGEKETTREIDTRVQAEERLLEMMQKAAEVKGIDPACVQSIFDLFRQGMDLLTLDPELDLGEIDGSYFTLIGEMAKLSGISEGVLLNTFNKKYLGVHVRLTQGKEIKGSILQKEARKLKLYNQMAESGSYDLEHGEEVELFSRDFVRAKVPEQHKIRYLSSLDVIDKNTREMVNELSKSSAQSLMEQNDPVMVVFHINDFITDLGDNKLLHQPGLRAVLNNLKGGVVRVGFRVPKDRYAVVEQQLEGTGLLGDKIILLPEGIDDALKQTGLQPQQVAFVVNSEFRPEEGLKDRIKNNEIKIFGIDKESAFHTTLLFGVIYARAGKIFENGKLTESALLAINSLTLMGMSGEEVKELLSQIEQDPFFRIQLITIEKTLQEFRNRRLYIEVAA